jgi:tetraprenyl-beta-curcumene synthase
MLATLAPRAHRDSVVEAIVALELLFDYLDGLTERHSDDPLGEGERLFAAFGNAVAVPSAGIASNFEQPPRKEDGAGYLEDLSRAVSVALARLPAAPAIAEVARSVALRAGQAQTRMHAAPQLGVAQLKDWALGVARDHNASANAGHEHAPLEWRELVVGSASSVLALHALIAAAADPHTTAEGATEIADAYLSTCVLLTLLDGLVDHEQDVSGRADRHPGREPDRQTGAAGYLDLYEDRDELADTMAAVARRAIMQARALPSGARHLMILVGVVAYYGSAPGADGELARPVMTRLRAELAPLLSPSLATVRMWRAARQRTRASGRKARRRTRASGPNQGSEDAQGWHSEERSELA